MVFIRYIEDTLGVAISLKIIKIINLNNTQNFMALFINLKITRISRRS